MNLKAYVVKKLPDSIKGTAMIRFFGLTKIPLLWFIKPSVLEMGEERCVVKVPLNRKTKNHLNSMYFGVLCAAADCAGGLTAMKYISESGENVSLAFKDFQAEFLKRAEGDTYFTNTQGKEIATFVKTVVESNERHHMPVEIVATVPSKFGEEPVAKFTLTLSLKKKG
ncbi:MAG: PaaI family thioesterase [Halobacteriovoraceae bacterium]|jgi:acyl-coenzyme A thioesterase PaaI-like protein|nr:PaaI family thioesterase [Halobacteriovoraceae bacterium]MBT5094706.1 PaaI family thioesterase [Halobacteriovoraceae bacterium]